MIQAPESHNADVHALPALPRFGRLIPAVIPAELRKCLSFIHSVKISCRSVQMRANQAPAGRLSSDTCSTYAGVGGQFTEIVAPKPIRLKKEQKEPHPRLSLSATGFKVVVKPASLHVMVVGCQLNQNSTGVLWSKHQRLTRFPHSSCVACGLYRNGWKAGWKVKRF